MLIIEIKNDGTGTERDANYTYVVRANDEVLETGVIRGHDRRDGWRTLLIYICTPPKYRSALRPAIVESSAPNNASTRLGEGPAETELSNDELDSDYQLWSNM